MRKPRHWERGAGTVWTLLPDLESLESVRSGDISIDDYRWRFNRTLIVRQAEAPPLCPSWGLHPGALTACVNYLKINESRVPVREDDTLCCSCARAAAAKGECHRVWAAELLRDAGWRVVLDGVELNERQGEERC